MDIHQIVNEKLNEIEMREHVKILHCVESGSRAWGFESPDSDYDIRFIYVHDKEWYLRLDEGRDVIEWQLDETLDINGWDLKKTFQLLHNSNPTVFEWDKSPIVYRTTPEWSAIRKTLPKYFCQKTMLHHYLGTATGNYRNYLKSDEVRLKKYFYALRPVLACEWVADKNCPPPMLFEELKAAYLPEYMLPTVDYLLELKKGTSEIGTGKRIDALNNYLDNEIGKFKELSKSLINKEYKGWDDLNDLFMQMLK